MLNRIKALNTVLEPITTIFERHRVNMLKNIEQKPNFSYIINTLTRSQTKHR